MSKVVSATAQSVVLNSIENKLMRYKGGISACNLFQCEKKETVITYIHERFQEIVQANPWLNGNCKKGKKVRSI